jgi:hypothetical protein
MEKLWEVYIDRTHPIETRGSKKAFEWLENVNFEELYYISYNEQEDLIWESFEVSISDYHDYELETLQERNYDGVWWSGWRNLINDGGTNGSIWLSWSVGDTNTNRHKLMKEKGYEKLVTCLETVEFKTKVIMDSWQETYISLRTNMFKHEDNETSNNEEIPF